MELIMCPIKTISRDSDDSLKIFFMRNTRTIYKHIINRTELHYGTKNNILFYRLLFRKV